MQKKKWGEKKKEKQKYGKSDVANNKQEGILCRNKRKYYVENKD
jgi:hypothetical protein